MSDHIKGIVKYHAKQMLRELNLPLHLSDPITEVAMELWNGRKTIRDLKILTAISIYIVAKEKGFKVRQIDLARLAGLSDVSFRNTLKRLGVKPMSLKDRLLKVLKDCGCLSIPELALILGVSKDTVKTYLRRLREEGVVVSVDVRVRKVWCLKEEVVECD